MNAPYPNLLSPWLKAGECRMRLNKMPSKRRACATIEPTSHLSTTI
jgi:hypothetical protein